MRDDYLWDGSGEPDPEIQKMESALGKLRYNRPAPQFPDLAKSAAPPRRFWQVFSWPQFASAAAVLLLTAAAVLLWIEARTPTFDPTTAWDVTTVKGTPQVGSQKIDVAQKTGKLGQGEVLETDNASKAVIKSDATGEIEVEPATRLRLVKSGSGIKRLSLERGTIRATIWAPPGEFVVDTPSAVAVDLGCVYTLHVDDSGAGLLRTTMGWVGFKLNGHESFIPAGAVCATRPRIGPGTPYFEAASPSFRDALTKFDFARVTPEERIALLGILLGDAKKQDALTLWHLLSRVSDAERPSVYDRLAALAPPPREVTREGVLGLDQEMLDSWWNSLGYGDVFLWHMYQRTWSEH